MPAMSAPPGKTQLTTLTRSGYAGKNGTWLKIASPWRAGITLG